jgi:hypothetical protein
MFSPPPPDEAVCGRRQWGTPFLTFLSIPSVLFHHRLSVYRLRRDPAWIGWRDLQFQQQFLDLVICMGTGNPPATSAIAQSSMS